MVLKKITKTLLGTHFVTALSRQAQRGRFCVLPPVEIWSDNPLLVQRAANLGIGLLSAQSQEQIVSPRKEPREPLHWDLHQSKWRIPSPAPNFWWKADLTFFQDQNLWRQNRKKGASPVISFDSIRFLFFHFQQLFQYHFNSTWRSNLNAFGD